MLLARSTAGGFMRSIGRGWPLLLCVLAGSLAFAGQAQASVSAVSCHRLNAHGLGQDLGGGMTRAQIFGGGLLEGTTKGVFAVTGFSGTVASIAGTVEFTTNRATLTVTVAGTLDVASGAFSASGPVTGATGKLSGATGDLAFTGVEDLSTGSFTEDVSGSVCADLSP
jgi:hypothetical protein